ncbi:FHA domain-containing protein [Paenibacillus sp. EC2-1]|uniref:FHA domain-containing protein n=1 Tax=Paenibacillus sp. EC2-1 TaxID=3388665 RepID=UPI003BEEE2EF
MRLRKLMGFRLTNKNKMYVHFGYDYYMYIGISKECKDAIDSIQASGLFVEECESPYYKEDEEAFLEVIIDDNGVSERVELHQQHFIIGRSAEVSQYVSQIVGTSRAHVEISRGTAGFKIKDLGSKNGTILKGEPMVPYKEYSLEEGDTFLIAGGKYMFRVA